MIEGMTRDLSKIGQLPEYNDYSMANRRVNRLIFTLELPKGNNITVFSDGTSMQVVSGGEYMREKYGKKNRRWVQIVILGDAKTYEPVSYEVHIIQESEAKGTEYSDIIPLGRLQSKNEPVDTAICRRIVIVFWQLPNFAKVPRHTFNHAVGNPFGMPY